ncbi:MAG: RnfABCDGE type electron transport complex subunit G [Candidatus Omnitrophota bacterium]
MKDLLHYGFILALICAVASSLLAGVNYFAKDRIIAQAQAEENAVLEEIFPQAANFAATKSEEEVLYYKAYDKNNKFIGVAFKASGKGYTGAIETMVGMDAAGNISEIKILSQTETPGLGSRITKEPFTGQFKNLNPKELERVEAITGATISSRAVIDSVRKKAEEIQELLKDEK